MKKLLILFALPLFLFSCKANFPVAQQSGKEDIAFLLFVSPDEYAGEKVQVSIDDAVAAERNVSVLMGSKADLRREWIEENVSFTLEDEFEVNL